MTIVNIDGIWQVRPHDLSAITLLMKSPLLGLDAQSKYFLIRAVWLFGDGVIGDQVAFLTKKFGMPAQKLAAAVGTLTGLHQGPDGSVQYFVEVPNGGLAHKGRGRPGRAIRLTNDFRDALWAELRRLKDGDAVESLGSINDRIVLALICGPSGWSEPVSGCGGGRGRLPDRSGAADRLSRLNRFILALLWSLATEAGVITGFGIAEISRLSGISRAQVDRQLDKLQRLGYIRQRCGGVSSAGIFGRATGFIFLDPLHEGLLARVSRDPYERKLSWHQMPLRDGSLEDLLFAFRQAATLSQQSMKLNRLKRGGGQELAQLLAGSIALTTDITLFYRELGLRSEVLGQHDGQEVPFYEVLGAVRGSVKAHALVVVCKHAGDILYNQGEGLLQPNPEIDREIIAKISSDVLVSGRKDKNGLSRPRDEEVAMWFYRMSHDLARMVFRFLSHKRGDQGARSWACRAIVPEFRSGEAARLALLVVESKW